MWSSDYFFHFGTTIFSKEDEEKNRFWRRFFDITSEKWDDDIHRLCNNIFKDCGLCPHLVSPPHCCLKTAYPPSTSRLAHIDGSRWWGEVVIGVSLGQTRVMRFTPSDYNIATVQERSVDVHLPRRSIYILSESSRYKWNHEILKQNLMEVPPDWNKENHRRSLTFRSTKVFSHVYYEKRIETDPSNQELKTRFANLKKYKGFQFGGYRSLRYDEDHPLVQREKVKMKELLDRMDDGDIPVQIRFQPSEYPYSQSSMISTDPDEPVSVAVLVSPAPESMDLDDLTMMPTSISSPMRDVAKRRTSSSGSELSDEGFVDQLLSVFENVDMEFSDDDDDVVISPLDGSGVGEFCDLTSSEYDDDDDDDDVLKYFTYFWEAIELPIFPPHVSKLVRSMGDDIREN